MSETKENIRLLLDKFMSGTTSLEEERQLGNYFSGNDVPEEWADYQAMFRYFEEGMPPELPPADGMVATRRPWLRWLAAASVLLLVGLGLYWAWPPEKPEMTARVEQTCPPVRLQRPTKTVARPMEKATAAPVARQQPASTAKQQPAAPNEQGHQPVEASSPTPGKAQADACREALDQLLRLQIELALAREDQQKASLEAQGYEAAYDENGAITYYQQQSENIIPL